MHSQWSVVDKIIAIKDQPAEQLEAFRAREVEALIESAPKEFQRRLRGIQFQVDAQRLKHPQPLGACMAISTMMQDSLVKLNAALCGQVPNPQEIEKPKTEVEVIPFR